MSLHIAPAELSDITVLADLCVQDALERRRVDPILWTLDADAHQKTAQALKAALDAENPAIRQRWIVAKQQGRIVGATHSILLPVPPIYAGEFGPPGLLMEDCFVVPDVPAGTQRKLLMAAEADLVAAGAKILLASSIAGGDWEAEYTSQNYAPLTCYFAKTGLVENALGNGVRHAGADDVPAIVAASAKHRRALDTLNGLFWKPHADADARFGGWMARSLTLGDRDMFVCETTDGFQGYAISQPVTALHVPTAHSIKHTGIIDDFFHSGFDLCAGTDIDPCARALLQAGETSRRRRGDHAVMVVCPAQWTSKIALLKVCGYHNALTWFIKQ